MSQDTDSQQVRAKIAIIAVKESDLLEMDTDLRQAFVHLQRCSELVNEQMVHGDNYKIMRGNVVELRAVIEDILLSIRLTENELHDLDAPGWE